MSNQPSSQDDGSFRQFVRGFWEMPAGRPNYMYSFLRGAIVSVVVSIITQVKDLGEILFWVVLVGMLWVTIDHLSWKRIAKKKGD